MGKFSYALEFYKNDIFKIDSDEDIKQIKIAINDANKIEKYFSNVLNIDLLRKNIIISFKFNKKLNYKDRINYIRGIVYSRRYIDFKDMFSFANILNIEYEGLYETSVYSEKCGSQRKDDDFFAEAFYEDQKTAYERLQSSTKKEMLNPNNELFINNTDSNIATFETEIVEDEEDDEYGVYEDDDENIINEVPKIRKDVLENYIDLSPEEIIKLFKFNFEEFIEIMLERKNVSKEENNRGRRFVIIGMRDWFNYMINIFEDLYNIGETKKKINSTDLSRFI